MARKIFISEQVVTNLKQIEVLAKTRFRNEAFNASQPQNFFPVYDEPSSNSIAILITLRTVASTWFGLLVC